MLLNMLIALVVLIVAILVYAATRPATFRLERATTINAPADKVFPHLNDFHNWTAWSPWEKLDPALKRTYSGAASGKGAVYAWEGNSKAGAGRMEITDSTPGSTVRIQLDFLKPFEAHNTTVFSLQPAGNATTLTWSMSGANNFMGKLFSVFVNMDKMVGKDFEAGLASLKSLAER